MRRSAGSDFIHASATAVTSEVPSTSRFKVARISRSSSGVAAGASSSARSGAPAASASAAFQSCTAGSRSLSQARASSLAGALSVSRWQRLAMVAGRRLARLGDEHQQCVGGRLLERLQKSVGAVRVQGLRVLDDRHLVAAAIARQRQRLDEPSNLVDLDLLRVLRETDSVQVRMTVRAQQHARRARAARRRLLRLAQRERRDPIRQPLRPETRRAQDQQSLRQTLRGAARAHPPLRTRAATAMSPRSGNPSSHPQGLEDLRGHGIDAVPRHRSPRCARARRRRASR